MSGKNVHQAVLLKERYRTDFTGDHRSEPGSDRVAESAAWSWINDLDSLALLANAARDGEALEQNDLDQEAYND